LLLHGQAGDAFTVARTRHSWYWAASIFSG
jgi:hypothetical protein